jgi:hypothetical protein
MQQTSSYGFFSLDRSISDSVRFFWPSASDRENASDVAWSLTFGLDLAKGLGKSFVSSSKQNIRSLEEEYLTIQHRQLASSDDSRLF